MKKKNSLNFGLGESRNTFDMVSKSILKGIFNDFLSSIMQHINHIKKLTIVPSAPWFYHYNPETSRQLIDNGSSSSSTVSPKR